MSYYDPSQQPPNNQPNWQQTHPGQQPSGPNWPPQQSGQLPPWQQPQTGPWQQSPPQYTQYPPYQQPGMPPQYPMPPQQPPRKPKVPGWAILLIIAIVALLGASITNGIGKSLTTTTNTTLTGEDIAATNSAQIAATNNPSCTATTGSSVCVSDTTPVPTATLDKSIPTSTPAPVAKWTTTHTFKGVGSKKTGVISVPSDWKIVWSCDHSSFSGYDYNMIITVYNSDSTYADSGVNSTCTKTNTHDETEEHQSGDVYLDIVSEGSWVIQVQEFK